MSTWTLDYELRAVSSDDPALHMLVTELRDEVDARQAHADEAAVSCEGRSLKPSRATATSWWRMPAGSPWAFVAWRRFVRG
jgi:hypothetical protein